ncbi:MAG TPA: hypothetical protein VEA59_05055 [Patescibacteria group bacterium]|nr:hypothetical protein [Patescibacteria group bacterium]
MKALAWIELLLAAITIVLVVSGLAHTLGLSHPQVDGVMPPAGPIDINAKPGFIVQAALNGWWAISAAATLLLHAIGVQWAKWHKRRYCLLSI